MSNKIISLGATALTVLTLAGIAQSNTSFANSTQPQEVLQTEGVQIPDMNLKKALNLALHQDENSTISPEQLAQIKSLDLSYQGISSLEGLQYCTNLEDLNISNFMTENSKETPNTISDLSPLKALQHLEAVDFRYLPVTDVSPLRDSSINWFYYGWTNVFSSTVETVTNEDDTITLKNPCVGFNGEVLKPKDLKGGVYNEKDNTITWSKDNFKKNAITSSDHCGNVLLEFEAEGRQENEGACINVYVNSQESFEQSIVIGGQGIGGYSDHSHDSGFARVTLNVKDHKASLVKGSDYQFHWDGWKSSTYASIKLTDPNGSVLYDQSWKGNESVKGNGYRKFGTFAQYDLPEGSTVEIYHAEGPWHRFHTSNDGELKAKLGNAGYTYTYKMQNSQLVLQSVDGKKVDENQFKNLFLNSNFKVEQKGTHYGIPNWTVATIDSGISGLSSLEDTYLTKRPINNAGTYLMDSNFYKFEDNSALYSVGSFPSDFIGVNDATHGVTITTSADNARSTCFSQTVDTKPGQKYHFSVDITPNKVTKTKLGGSSISSEFLEKNFMITCENEDGSHLGNINAHMMKKNGNTYSVDIPAKSNKIKFYIFLGSAQGVGGFYSAQINNLSLTQK